MTSPISSVTRMFDALVESTNNNILANSENLKSAFEGCLEFKKETGEKSVICAWYSLSRCMKLYSEESTEFTPEIILISEKDLKNVLSNSPSIDCTESKCTFCVQLEIKYKTHPIDNYTLYRFGTIYKNMFGEYTYSVNSQNVQSGM